MRMVPSADQTVMEVCGPLCEKCLYITCFNPVEPFIPSYVRDAAFLRETPVPVCADDRGVPEGSLAAVLRANTAVPWSSMDAICVPSALSDICSFLNSVCVQSYQDVSDKSVPFMTTRQFIRLVSSRATSVRSVSAVACWKSAYETVYTGRGCNAVSDG